MSGQTVSQVAWHAVRHDCGCFMGRVRQVIKLKCDRCGQVMKVPEEYGGKKGRCPRCKEVLTVPRRRSASGPAARSGSSPVNTPTQAALRSEGASRPGAKAQPVGNRVRRLLLPSYDEISMFLMSAAVVLITLFDPSLRKMVVGFLFSVNGIFWAGVYIAMYLCGLALSIYHIFSSRSKSQTETYLMLFFAVLTNGLSGIGAGIYLLSHSVVWVAIFPMCNILSGTALMLMLWFDVIDRQCVSEREGTILQAGLGLAAMLAVFLACTYVLKLHWVLTLSICIAYASNIDKAIQSIWSRKVPCDQGR